MFDISDMRLNMSPYIIEPEWATVQEYYRQVESELLGFEEVNDSFKLQTHFYGGFRLSISNNNPLEKLLNSHNFHITISKKRYSRGRKFYPGLTEQKNNLKILTNIVETSRSLNLAYLASVSGQWVLPATSIISAYLDYIRNYLLICIFMNNTIIRYIDPNFPDSSTEMRKIVQEIEVQIYQSLKRGKCEYFEFAESTNIVLTEFEKNVKDSKQLDVIKYRKNLIRESRELDSLAHIFLFAEKVTELYIPEKTLLVGFEYGGIELPFAINAVRYYCNKSLLGISLVHISQYSRGAKYDKPTIEELFSPNDQSKFTNSNGVLALDDSVTTARSLDIFNRFVSKYQKKFFCAVAMFKSSHRYHHITMKDHGGINPTVLNLITLFSQAPYGNTYKENTYTNRSGVFDKNKDQLYRALEVNE